MTDPRIEEIKQRLDTFLVQYVYPGDGHAHPEAEQDMRWLLDRIKNLEIEHNNFGGLIRAVDAMLNMDWENSVRIEAPEGVPVSDIMNRLQDARDGIDAMRFYLGMKD